MKEQEYTYSEDRISLHFTMEEFVNSETARTHGIDNRPYKAEELTIRELVKRLLQPLRIAYGKPIRISSGYRCPALNRLVGGVASSRHITGEAADCVVEDPEGLLSALETSGLPFDQVIWYRKRGFIHISLRREQRNRKSIRIE